LDIAIQELEVGESDRLLLCSDGLSGMVPDDEIWKIVRGAEGLQRAAELLVNKAIENGGEDNVTVIIVGFESGNPFA